MVPVPRLDRLDSVLLWCCASSWVKVKNEIETRQADTDMGYALVLGGTTTRIDVWDLPYLTLA
jgi:hypothetical protein